MPGSEEIYQNMPSKASKVKIPQEQSDHGKHHRNDQHSTSHYLESQGRNNGCTHTNMLLLSLCVLLLCGIIVLGVFYAIQEKTLQQQNNPGSLTGQCFDGWESFNGSCYYFSHDVLNWTASRDECRSVGGHLVIIDRKETQIYFTQKINKSEDDFWIGLTDSEKEGQWKWVDNTDLKLKFWHKGQPNNSKGFGNRTTGEDCGIVRHVPRSEHNWFDEYCGSPNHRICEV